MYGTDKQARDALAISNIQYLSLAQVRKFVKVIY